LTLIPLSTLFNGNNMQFEDGLIFELRKMKFREIK